MENGKIPASAITASSSYIYGLVPNFARLNSHSAWTMGYHPGPHLLQVDLGRIMALKMVATQGRPIASHRQWVRSYEILSSLDGNAGLNQELVKYMENNAVKVSSCITLKLMPRSHQSLNMFKSCLVKHGLNFFFFTKTFLSSSKCCIKA